MTINKEQGLFKPSRCCRGTFYLKQAFALSAFRMKHFFAVWKMTSASMGKKNSPSGLVPAWAGEPSIHSRKPKLSKNYWQLRRPRAGTEPPEQSSRGCVQQEAKKILDTGHWNRKPQCCGCTPGTTSLTLWLMKDHGAALTGLPVQARPEDVLYQLQHSSSPAGKGVIETPSTLENTQMYTSCGKKGVTGHKDTCQKPRGVTHPQDTDMWWSHMDWGRPQTLLCSENAVCHSQTHPAQRSGEQPARN